MRSEENLVRIREILKLPLDWSFLQDAADFHRVTPLLCSTLQSLEPAAVPQRLASEFQASVRKALLLTGELMRVLELLRRHGITAVPYKGPSLAIAAFQNLALRSFDDLDLLVSRADVWRARDVLVAAGYRETAPLGPQREQALLDRYDELVLEGANGFPLLELHWALLAPHYAVRSDMEAYLARRVSISLGDRTVPSLAPDDLLLALCLHAAKHCWSALRPVCDIAWLMSGHPLDWSALLVEARRLRVVRILLLAVTLTNRLFGMPIPEPLRQPCVRDKTVSALADHVISALFGKPHDETAIVSSAVLYMRMREDPRDKLVYLLRLAGRPGLEDWQAINLPSRWEFLYPLLRLPRLAKKYWLPRTPAG